MLVLTEVLAAAAFVLPPVLQVTVAKPVALQLIPIAVLLMTVVRRRKSVFLEDYLAVLLARDGRPLGAVLVVYAASIISLLAVAVPLVVREMVVKPVALRLIPIAVPIPRFLRAAQSPELRTL